MFLTGANAPSGIGLSGLHACALQPDLLAAVSARPFVELLELLAIMRFPFQDLGNSARGYFGNPMCLSTCLSLSSEVLNVSGPINL